MKLLSPHLSTSYEEIVLSLSTPPGKDQLSDMVAKSSDYQQRWASRLLDKLKNGESLQTSYPYPLQIWRFGDQTLMALGGEAVIEYAIELKRILDKKYLCWDILMM